MHCVFCVLKRLGLWQYFQICVWEYLKIPLIFATIQGVYYFILHRPAHVKNPYLNAKVLTRISGLTEKMISYEYLNTYLNAKVSYTNVLTRFL